MIVILAILVVVIILICKGAAKRRRRKNAERMAQLQAMNAAKIGDPVQYQPPVQNPDTKA